MAEGKLQGGTGKETECDWGVRSNETLSVAKDSRHAVVKMISVLKRDAKAPFAYDESSGVLTRRDALARAYFVAGRLPNPDFGNVAVMLPASAGTGVVLLAAFVTGHAPVMLNWTLGENAFEHCVKTGKVTEILTSRRFFEKAAPEWMREKYASRCRFLEDLLAEASVFEKALAFAKAVSPFAVASKLSDTAVMLFTSGSESLPKAVSLTWDNVASDVDGAISVMPVKRDDVLFSFLPVFHSFGFTIGTILPLLTGLPTAYTPDPGDSRTVCLAVRKSRATLLASPPTFFKLALETAKPGDLDSLRKLVVGAEKCPEELFSRVAKEYPELVILEGYGITECSPVISINPPEKPKPGTV